MVSIAKRTMVVISLMLFCTIVLPYRTFKTNPSTPRCGKIEHCCTGRRHGNNLIVTNIFFKISPRFKVVYMHKCFIFVAINNAAISCPLAESVLTSRRIVIFYHAVLERRGKRMNDCHVISTFCNRSIL
jgi:hypothetical protein